MFLKNKIALFWLSELNFLIKNLEIRRISEKKLMWPIFEILLAALQLPLYS